MANIDLERNESSSILPWIIGLAVAALVIWGIAEAFEEDDAAIADAEMYETEYDNETEYSDVDTEPREQSPTSSVALASITESPDAWIGRTLPDDIYSVASVPTDRGFWIEEGDAQLMAIIIDEPVEAPIDINEGAMLRITDGTLRAPSYLAQLPGRPATDETLTMARDQEVFLVVDERNVSIARTAAR